MRRVRALTDGADVKDINYVLNYDFPGSIET